MWNDPFGNDVWTSKGQEYLAQFYERDEKPNYGVIDRGYQWKEVFLQNGTEVKMTYKGRAKFSRIVHENLIDEDGVKFDSPAKWANAVANNTSRNAWRDIWVKFPDTSKWVFADDIKRKTKAQVN